MDKRLATALIAALALAPACDGGPGDGADSGPDGGASYEPDEAFWASTGAESLTFEFEGRLNDPATDYDDLKQARGLFTAALASGTTGMEEGQLGWLGQFSAECSEPALCGRPYVVLSAYRTVESGASSMTAIHVNVYAMADAIEAALSAGGRELPFGDGLVFLHEWEVTVKPDGTRLDRICTLAIEAGAAGSRLFVGGGEAPALAIGEPLHLYGNVALATDPAVIAADDPALEPYGGLLCEFLVDDAPASADEYDAALADDGPQLSCELPEGYLEPLAPDYLTVTFAGEINAADAEYLTYGSAVFGAGVGGEAVGDALYSAYATRTGASSGTDYVAVTALDDVVSDGAGGYAFAAIGVEALTGALVAAKEAGEPSIGAGSLFVYVADAEQYYASSTEVYTRLCPIAVSDPASTASSLYVCLDASEGFDVGEALELAGNVVLSADPAVVAEASGLPEGETCFCSLNEEAIPCDEYP